MKILIVDDLDDARVMMHKLLEKMGHDVEMAVNGLEGLDTARKFFPDLIFTDIMMPEMDGFQLCRAVNEDANLKHIPVVIHSATFDEAEDEIIAMKSGATSFIRKPVSEKEFLNILNRVINSLKTGELDNIKPGSVSSKELDIMHYRSLVNKLYKKTENLQNEIASRKNAYELLKINEDRYRSLLNNAPNVVVCMTGEHFITEFNKEAERIYGYTRAEVVGKDYLELFVPQAEHENVAADIQKVLAGEPTFGYENPIISKNGSKRTLLWNVTNMLNGDGNSVGVVAMGVDITDRNKIEEDLEKSKYSLAEAERIAHLGSWDLDLAQNKLRWSDEIYRIFGLDPEQFGATYEAFLNTVHPDDRERIDKAYKDSIKQNKPFNISHRIIRPDGQERIVHEKCEHFCDENGNVIRSIGMVHDITERRILERAVIDFEEDERKRIGHDLHDDVGQLMTGLGFKAQSLLGKLKDINGDVYREGEEISELVEQAKNKLRHLSKGLLPVDLTETGFMESIEGLVSDMNSLFDIKCNFNCIEPFNIKNKDVIVHLYRIVQEAVTNALKHAKAEKIEIKLDRSNENVTMTIKDNGVGISESELSTGGIGLKIMEYRARLINASLKIYKNDDSGTVVKCVMTDR